MTYFMFSKYHFDKTDLSLFLNSFWLFFISWTTFKPIQVIISFKFFIKSIYFYCWLVCIVFIGSAFIDTVTVPRVWLKIVSGTYPNRTYGFSSPTGLWRVVVRMMVLWFHLLPSIDWLDSMQFISLFKFEVVY